MFEQTPPDYIEPLRAEDGIKVGVIEQNQAYMVLNQALPPFNNIKARQAVAHVMDQAKFVAAMGYPPDLRRDYCAPFFICGSPNETDAGSMPYAHHDPAPAHETSIGRATGRDSVGQLVEVWSAAQAVNNKKQIN